MFRSPSRPYRTTENRLNAIVEVDSGPFKRILPSIAKHDAEEMFSFLHSRCPVRCLHRRKIVKFVQIWPFLERDRSRSPRWDMIGYFSWRYLQRRACLPWHLVGLFPSRVRWNWCKRVDGRAKRIEVMGMTGRMAHIIQRLLVLTGSHKRRIGQVLLYN